MLEKRALAAARAAIDECLCAQADVDVVAYWIYLRKDGRVDRIERGGGSTSWKTEAGLAAVTACFSLALAGRPFPPSATGYLALQLYATRHCASWPPPAP